MGRPGHNYSDYFAVGSWPYELRELSFRKLSITNSNKLEFGVLCEPSGQHVFSKELQVGSHTGQHIGALVTDASNPTKTTAHVCRMGAAWVTSFNNKPVKWWFAGCIVSRQQMCQCNLYYTEEDDDVFMHSCDWPQMRAEMTSEICSDDIMERIMARLAECEVQKKTPPVKKPANKKRIGKFTQVKKGSKKSTKKSKVDSEEEDEEEEVEEEAKPTKKANTKKKGGKVLTE